MKTKSTVVRFKAPQFRRMQNPDGSETCEFWTPVKGLPAAVLSDWKKVNPRDVKRETSVYRSILNTLQDAPEDFFHLNRGLTLIASKAVFNEKLKEAEVHLSDETLNGLVDGGHSADACHQANLFALEPEQAESWDLEKAFISVKVKVGVNPQKIAEVAGGLNTSTQVDVKSLENLKGHFQDMRQLLDKLNAPYRNKIAYKMNEVDPTTGEPKPIDIREILYYLAPFDCGRYSKTLHPVHIFGRKEQLLREFADEMSGDEEREAKAKYSFGVLISKMHDILQFRDRLVLEFNDPKYGFGRLKAGRKNERIRSPGRKHDLFFLDQGTITGGIPIGHLMPMLAAFRANVIWNKPKDSFSWKVDNEELLKVAAPMLAETIKQFHEQENSRPEYVGRNSLAWHSCYREVEVALMQMK